MRLLHFFIVVDAMLSFLHHIRIMRRIWLTLLVAFSLTVGGVASAWAAQACPYKQAAAAGSHDCCPDQKPEPQPSDHHGKSLDCQLGQSCRTAQAVEPLQPVLTIARAEVVVALSPRNQQPAPTAISSGLWRPPRTA